jgi:preprotein translocase subunit YajC
MNPQTKTLIIYIVFFAALMYFMIFLPQKKKDKKTKEMLNSMSEGDNVVTIGGVSGKIINIREDEITIETSVEKTKLNYKKWAIREVIKSSTEEE